MPLIPLAHARDARERFAPGHSGNPRGRPRGIPNPPRRLPDLRARPLGPEALSAFLDRKPHLLLPLAAQFLPPPAVATDPMERLGIDLARIAGPADLRAALSAVFAALARGEVSAAEAGRVGRRLRARRRLLGRLARLQKRLRLTGGAVPR